MTRRLAAVPAELRPLVRAALACGATLRPSPGDASHVVLVPPDPAAALVVVSSTPRSTRHARTRLERDLRRAGLLPVAGSRGRRRPCCGERAA